MNLIHYTVDDHHILLSSIDPDALKVVSTLQKAGFIAYIVGGGVRDLLLGLSPKDYDISTSARPEEIKQLFRSHCLLIGRRFRLAHIRFGKKIIEVATFRAGNNESDELILRDNEWGNAEQDVLRRDFTINGLFYDPATETLIDYVGGYKDLQKKILRTIGQPYLRFKQDPVRMIRLIKFQARLQFTIESETKIALLESKFEIVKSSQARIFEELLRMLESGAAETFIRLMKELGFLEYLLPSLAHFLDTEDGKQIYRYLNEIDIHPQKKPFDRAFLLCCLVFPFLEKHLHLYFIDRGKKLHLGNIQQETQIVISSIFKPFFILPRKLRMKMVSILTTQFRMTPFEKKKQKKIRIPHDTEFPLSLDFLHLRSYLDLQLTPSFKMWKEAYQSHSTKVSHHARH